MNKNQRKILYNYILTISSWATLWTRNAQGDVWEIREKMFMTKNLYAKPWTLVKYPFKDYIVERMKKSLKKRKRRRINSDTNVCPWQFEEFEMNVKYFGTFF